MVKNAANLKHYMPFSFMFTVIYAVYWFLL